MCTPDTDLGRDIGPRKGWMDDPLARGKDGHGRVKSPRTDSNLRALELFEQSQERANENRSEIAPNSRAQDPEEPKAEPPDAWWNH